MSLEEKYLSIRKHSENICKPLSIEDYVVQPVEEVSPPKWHLGHSSWFFETFVLKPHYINYKEFHPEYDYLFNSYYESIGRRVIRTDRGNMSRPAVQEIYNYREHVDQGMSAFLEQPITRDIEMLITLGLNHEQQHQELLLSDIKYILGHNPLFPSYSKDSPQIRLCEDPSQIFAIKAGLYQIGYCGTGFCFDNELGNHHVYLQEFQISSNLVTNEEFLEFIAADGYTNFQHWHAEGWDWINESGILAPMYWHKIDGSWVEYTLNGLKALDLTQPVTHVSYYEAYAYASWKNMRLPTEFEWEVSAEQFNWGHRWEWTESAYLPYPGFSKAPGAIGEYNGKFMVNQKVLRGASQATPVGHSRPSYRNFFHPHLRWQFTGIRLAK